MKRRSLNKAGAIALAALLTMSSLAACSSNDSSGGGNAGNTTTAAATAGADNKTEETTAAGESVSASGKDEVIIITSSEPTVFICQDSTYSSAMAKDSPVIYNIYSYLLWMDEEGNCVPWLATDYEKSDDGMEYIFHLRDDVYFHNGEHMTAEDVAFTYNLCAEKNPNLTTNLLINFKEAIVVDDYTVKFVLTSPFDGFPSETTSRVGSIICKKYYEEVGSEGYMEKPIGTGPYMFESRISGQEIVLKAFPDYFEGEPPIKTVRIRPVANVTTSFISLKSGDIDFINLADIASCQQLTENDNATYITSQSTSRSLLLYNCRETNPELATDYNLRKAIQYGINKEEIVIGALSGEGMTIDMDAPYFFNGAPDEGSFVTIPPAGDVEKAKEYLSKSNYKGAPLQLICVSGTVEERACQIIQGQLLNVGINIEIVATDTGTNVANQKSGNYDLMLNSTTGSLCDVSTLNSFWCVQGSEGPIWPAPDWETLQNICFDANVAAGQERKDCMAALADIINEQAYDVPVYCKNSCVAFNKDLQGVKINTNGTWRVKDWSWK